MTTVTVDLADLEKLVFVTAAIKTIEGALDLRKKDPFVVAHLDFTDAHNRLAAAMRDVQRGGAGTLVDYNEPLSKEELKALRLVVPGFMISSRDKKPKKGEDMVIWDRLNAKGCVEIGQVVKGVIFAGSTQVEAVVADHEWYALRLTARGKALLSK